jgi:hypothetical protein
MSIYGGEDCVAHVSIDDGEEINVDYFTRPVSSAEKEITITLSSLDYGAHKITVFLTKQLGDTLITSNIINNTLTFISGNQTEPILTVPFYEDIVT